MLKGSWPTTSIGSLLRFIFWVNLSLKYEDHGKVVVHLEQQDLLHVLNQLLTLVDGDDGVVHTSKVKSCGDYEQLQLLP